jgi:putative transposase
MGNIGVWASTPKELRLRNQLRQIRCHNPYLRFTFTWSFSTKERRPFLRDSVLRQSLHAYLGAVSKQLECPPLKVGGVEDHVHLLCRFTRTITQAEWVKEIKRVSNLWLKEQGRDYLDFQWQGGYASFSVSQSNLPEVVRYIAEQERHHRRMTFQDELRALLRKHDLEWDERYVWD